MAGRRQGKKWCPLARLVAARKSQESYQFQFNLIRFTLILVSFFSVNFYLRFDFQVVTFCSARYFTESWFVRLFNRRLLFFPSMWDALRRRPRKQPTMLPATDDANHIGYNWKRHHNFVFYQLNGNQNLRVLTIGGATAAAVCLLCVIHPCPVLPCVYARRMSSMQKSIEAFNWLFNITNLSQQQIIRH